MEQTEIAAIVPGVGLRPEGDTALQVVQTELRRPLLGIRRDGPRQLRSLVETEINALIDRDLWERQEAQEAREKKSIEALLRWWANVENLRGSASV